MTTTTISIGLTDKQQAYLMLIAAILPAIMAWLGLGMPVDKASIALLLSDILTGIIFYIKEISGITPPNTGTQGQAKSS